MAIVIFGQSTASSNPVNPPGPAGGLTPAIWLASDRIGGQSGGNRKISSWDENGTLNVMTQFDSTRQPTLLPSGLNGLPLVRFGSGQNLSGAQVNVEYTQPWTLVAVVKTGGRITLSNIGLSTGPAVTFFDLNASTLSTQIQHSNTQLVNVTWPVAGLWNTIAITYLGFGLANGLTAWVNGVLATPTIVNDNLGALTTRANAPWFVGSPGVFTGGDIAEVMLFTPQISNTDRLTVESYLYTKWFVLPTTTTAGTGTRGTGQDILNLTAFPIQAPFDQDQ